MSFIFIHSSHSVWRQIETGFSGQDVRHLHGEGSIAYSDDVNPVGLFEEHIPETSAFYANPHLISLACQVRGRLIISTSVKRIDEAKDECRRLICDIEGIFKSGVDSPHSYTVVVESRQP